MPAPDDTAAPYKPTPGELNTLRVLQTGSLGYWQWRAAVVGPANRLRFRRAWGQKLTHFGLIEIDSEQAVHLTAAGRAALAIARGETQ